MKTIHSEKSGNGHNGYRFAKLLVFFCCLFLNNSAQAEECLLAKQLKDPYIRAEYEAVIAASQTNGTNLNVEDMYGNIQTASTSELPSFSGQNISGLLDPITMECLACHDGTLAKAAKYRISDGNFHRVKSIETIKGAHPIGMDYMKFSWNKEYAPAEMLPANMVLMDGKVGCVTCHNLLDSKEMYVVVENSSSELCFSCHKK